MASASTGLGAARPVLVAGASLGLAPLPGHRGGDTRPQPSLAGDACRARGAVSARGRRRLAHDCDFAASLMHRLRGSRLLSLPAAPPWPAACLLTPARSTQPHTGTRTHSLGHTPATHTCPRDRAHRTGHAPTRRLGQAGPLAPSCACAHTGVHVFSSLSRTWLATLHLARASAGQRPSPGAARGQTQQVPAAL